MATNSTIGSVHRFASEYNSQPAATPTENSNMVRVIFNVHGTDYPHDLLRRLLLTSKYITDKCREQTSDIGNMLELLLRSNLRDIGPMWHYWVLYRQLVPNYFLPHQYVQANLHSAEMREYNFFLDLLACLSLSHYLGDETFEEATRNKIINKLRTGSDQAIFIACLNEEVVCDLFSMFHRDSSVRHLIVNATVEFGTIGDILELHQRDGYPREYVTAVAIRAFEEMLRFKFGDQAAESTRLFIAPKVEKKEPRSWEIAIAGLQAQAAAKNNINLHK